MLQNSKHERISCNYVSETILSLIFVLLEEKEVTGQKVF